MRRILFAGMLLALLAAPSLPARAEERDPSAWLDDPAIEWNRPGDAIIAPPEGMSRPPYCADQIRDPETDADRQVADAGWSLILGYESGWGTTIVRAAAGFDANCRASPYVAFFFVDGVYAGRSAPLPGWPRTDGALDSATLASDGAVHARYHRYSEDSPLCCPDATTIIIFTPERTPDGPVMNPTPRRVLVAPDDSVIADITPEAGTQSTP